jgi:hypothetical protein
MLTETDAEALTKRSRIGCMKRVEEALAILHRHNAQAPSRYSRLNIPSSPRNETKLRSVRDLAIPLRTPIRMDGDANRNDADPHRAAYGRSGQWLGLPESEIEQLRAASAF